MAEQKRRTRTNIFQTLIETQSSDEQLDLGVVDSDNDPEYNCEGSGSSESESEVVASTSRTKVRPRFRSSVTAKRGGTKKSQPTAESSTRTKSKFRSSMAKEVLDLDVPQTIDSDVDQSDESEPEVDLGTELEVSAVEPDTDTTNKWTENLDRFPTMYPFSGEDGLNLNMIDIHNCSEMSIFHLFMDHSIMKLIKKETNEYAAELAHSDKHKNMAVVKSWKTLTINEMYGFILIHLHMGYLTKLCISDYWTLQDFCSSKFAAKILTRDRFRAILSMLHFSSNRNYIPIDQAGHDPLYKIRPIYEHLQKKFEQVYRPKKQIAIDEAICGWRGRLRFKVYLKDKPTPWGIKMYELCESGSGYVFRFEIYAREPGLSNRPTDVVLRLMEPLLGQGYHLYTDNYYSCPELFTFLMQKQTMCTGTVRANRLGMPREMMKQTLNPGESTFRRKDNLVALKWRDKRDVNMLTSATDPRETVTVTTRNVTNKVKPKVIAEYSRHMSAVDQSDQLLSYLPLKRRTSKWTTKMFMHLLTLTIIQSSILWNKVLAAQQRRRMPLPRFFKNLGKQLTEHFIRARGVTIHRPPPRPVTKASSLLCLDQTKFHCLNSLPETQAQDKPRRDCRVCYERCEGVPSKSLYITKKNSDSSRSVHESDGAEAMCVW
ncbi:hypothetical protein RRG08_003154 [Elysia crispata]|uniref:PiggyBac transposable element-derived protein domain-containing protein n=1 Tax=Elysia crispata TaxID=231223 RepID=A0AAE1B7A6_9GAST|nr:hypothetical protein RRG08_003154 [Elysia crispata]